MKKFKKFSPPDILKEKSTNKESEKLKTNDEIKKICYKVFFSK